MCIFRCTRAMCTPLATVIRNSPVNGWGSMRVATPTGSNYYIISKRRSRLITYLGTQGVKLVCG